MSENEFLLHALCMGAFITFLYDCLRILRRVLPHGGFLVSLEDLVFWIYCAEQVFLLMYRESNGTLRWFAVLGALAGMFFIGSCSAPVREIHICSAVQGPEPGGEGSEMDAEALFLCGKEDRQCPWQSRRTIPAQNEKIRRAIKMRLTFFLKLFKMNLKA